MGSWKLTCMVTGIGIQSKSSCFVIPLSRNELSLDWEKDFLMKKQVYSDSLLKPVSSGLFCKYEDSGSFRDLEGFEEYNKIIAESFLDKSLDETMDEFYERVALESMDKSEEDRYNLVPVSLGAFNTIVQERDSLLLYNGLTYATDIFWPYKREIPEMEEFIEGDSTTFIVELMKYLKENEFKKYKSLEVLSKIEDRNSEEYKDILADYLSESYGRHSTINTRFMNGTSFNKSVFELDNFYDLVASSLIFYGFINSSRIGFMTTFGAGSSEDNEEEVLLTIKASQKAILDNIKMSLSWSFGDREPTLKNISYIEYKSDFDKDLSDFSKKFKLDYVDNEYLLNDDLEGFVNSLPFELSYELLKYLNSLY